MMNPNYYAIIPANVRYSTEVPDGAKLLYGEITALCNQHGYCWASNRYFADLYKKSIDTVGRWIGDLARAGFIMTLVDKESGNGRKIWLSDSQGIGKNAGTPTGKNAARVSAKTPVGYRQKCREATGKNAAYNNTVNNTLNNTEEEKALRENSAAAESKTFALEAEKNPPPKFRAAPPQPAADFGRIDPAAEVARMRADDMAREVFTRTRRIPAQLYDQYLTDFETEVSATQEPHYGVAKFRGHFFNWAGKRYQIAQDRAKVANQNAYTEGRPSTRAGS